jgi:hypothetical protein
MEDLPREAKARNLQIAIVAVPESRVVTEKLVAAGMERSSTRRGRIKAGAGRPPEGVDLAIELGRSPSIWQGSR